MNCGKYIFSQIIELFPRDDFELCVEKYKGERYVKNFSCRDQLLAMSFGQLSYRESLRDVVACLSSHRSKLYHLGFHSSVALPTLSHANEKRDWRIYKDFAQILIKKAQQLYLKEPSVSDELNGACYAIDSTSIDLCLSLFPWAPFIKTKSAIKLHALMDLRGSIPVFFDMTNGKTSDVSFLDIIEFDRDAFYVMDRGYIDYGRLHKIHSAGAFFVTRTKTNSRIKRRYSNTVDRSTGVICDQTVFFTGKKTSEKYPDTIRRIKYKDRDTGKVYTFFTNNFKISASSISLLYKHRWQIELFFKWIKQHLKIKSFWGYSENAVKTQICIALCVYLIVAILKKRLNLPQDLYEILQILSISLFDKSGLNELFSRDDLQKLDDSQGKTLPLFDF